MLDTWNKLISTDLTLDELNKSEFEIFIERLFKIRERNTTISKELKCESKFERYQYLNEISQAEFFILYHVHSF